MGGLNETPSRVARMWVEELTVGYRLDPKEVLKSFTVDNNYEKYGELIIVRDIPVRSICEHYLLPFFGYTYSVYT